MGADRCRLTSEDAARVMSPDAEWWRPTLTSEQEDELLTLIKPALSQDGKRRFRWFVALIFASAVERYTAFSGKSPRVLLREELDQAAERLRKPDREAEEGVPYPMQEVLEIALEEEIPPEVRIGGSFSKWMRELPPESLRALQLRAIKRVYVEVKKGPSNVIDRLMVRGLAALVSDLTGVVPRRTYRHPNKSGGRAREAYWFLDLATKLAVFVNRALPPKLRRPGVSALTGIVAEELKALKKAQPPNRN